MKWLRILGLLLTLGVDQRAHAQSEATVTWTTTYQTIVGFGASDHQNGQPPLSSAQQTTLFSPTNGIGLSLLRIGTPEDGSCTSISAACANNSTNGGSGNMSDAVACAANGCRVIASSWTPPASMKTNGDITCKAGSGDGALLSGSYSAFATYLSNFIASLQAYKSINLYAISPQNEPSACESYDSAVWTGAQLSTFIKANLGPTLAANGQSNVLIYMPDSANWANLTTYANSCMNDSACKSYVDAVAYHAYDSTQPSSYSNPYSLPLWQTEASDAPSYGLETCSGHVWCPDVADALTWSYNIHLNMIAGTQVWLYWNTQQAPSNTGNSGLYGSDNTTLATRAYAIGNWSKFVRPGWVRIDATANPQTDVYVTAFKNASTGTFAIVAMNRDASDKAQTFSLSGFTATSVTPYITDSTLNLEQQATVTAGSVFSYTLPAQSVTTFVGTDGGSSTRLAPPTGLTLVVR